VASRISSFAGVLGLQVCAVCCLKVESVRLHASSRAVFASKTASRRRDPATSSVQNARLSRFSSRGFIAAVITTSVLAISLNACAISSGLTSTSESPNTVLPKQRAAPADAFVDSVGVVTHLSYTDTPYFTAWPEVLNALENLGVRHIRDGYYAWMPSSDFIAEHQALADAGIGTDYVVPMDSATTPETIEKFAPEVRDMEQLEAPNECDVPGNCGPNGLAGIYNMLGFLPTIDDAGANLGIPIVGPSFTQQSSFVSAGNVSGRIADNNLHVYFGGRNPGSDGWGGLDLEGNSYGSLAWWLDQAHVDAPGMPVEITETGYMAYPTTRTPFTLPESVEASYTPRTLLLAFQKGIKRTYLYELLDEVSSPGYGILRSDLTPKPAFRAVESLISNLQDKGPSFSPGMLAFSIKGGGRSLNHVLLQKRDGSFWLVLWLEEASFDPETAAPIEVTPQEITLTLAAPDARQVLRWDTEGNMRWANVTMQGNTLSLKVSDQIAIVKIVR
jgi:hypothetical protein